MEIRFLRKNLHFLNYSYPVNTVVLIIHKVGDICDVLFPDGAIHVVVVSNLSCISEYEPIIAENEKWQGS